MSAVRLQVEYLLITLFIEKINTAENYGNNSRK